MHRLVIVSFSSVVLSDKIRRILEGLRCEFETNEANSKGKTMEMEHGTGRAQVGTIITPKLSIWI